MAESNTENKSPPKEHIANIYKEYTTPSRVLRSFANLSNTVIQTALSGQSKFVFEILQNADDAFEDHDKDIEVRFALQDNFLIVHHNGKGFDYNDVERICDYASQIEEVKASDLRKTGYKGLGFKSLFNLSDCIYICSNGYSFRFDKTHWNDSESKPWQVIPIWCGADELPLCQEFSYDQPVNIILKVNHSKLLESQLREIVDRPELLLYLNRINKLSVDFCGEKHFMERREGKSGVFNKIDFLRNQQIASTWLSRTYCRPVDAGVQKSVGGGSRFIYPDKIKKAEEVSITFTLRSDEALESISRIAGLCYSTLPTQLHLTLPYHINSLFILNLDRTQLHENEWNEFLLYQMGILQFHLLRDLAEVTYLKNYVVELFVRGIDHPFNAFSNAFLKGFRDARSEIGWLPPHHGTRLLKLGEVWTDEIQFFKQKFQNIHDHEIYSHLISYDVRHPNYLHSDKGEANHFTFETLLQRFSQTYYSMFNVSGYVNFISYLHEISKDDYDRKSKLKNASFLRAKNGNLLTPTSALLEENDTPIPAFLQLNPIDNEYLPSRQINLIKEWLVSLGARRLKSVILILRESILKWVDSYNFSDKIQSRQHMEIVNYLAKGFRELTYWEAESLQEKLLIRTESGQFKNTKLCYLSCVVPIKEFADIISNDKISSSYNLGVLRNFFIWLGVHEVLHPIDVLRKSVLLWIKNGEIAKRLTVNNYYPIIEYVAETYLSVESSLRTDERNEFKKMLVLTRNQTFQKAQDCFFDTAIPNVKGFEGVISNNEIVAANGISKNVKEFFIKIGVQEKINPIIVIRRSILKWISENQITKKITSNNHVNILQYIADNWNDYCGLKEEEKKYLKRIPILTKSNTFREANTCYFPSNPDSRKYEEIPMIDSIISSDELISLEYYSIERADTSSHWSIQVKDLLRELGVRCLSFVDICERYCDHLTRSENVKWFFSELVSYWNKTIRDEALLKRLQQKFNVSCRLLAKNGSSYCPRELYSSCFDNIQDIDPNSIPLLEYDKTLPRDLEKWLGFNLNLDFHCINQLLNAVDRTPNLGAGKTLIFFKTLLDELRQKDKSEIKKHELRLLSQDNKLTPAKDLHYFMEEHKTCVLDSCYLKRIPNMSHKNTLELAELCGVHTLPFSLEVQAENETLDNTLKEFYLQRLPFIVTQESKKMNEEPSITLRRLYDAICDIQLFDCQHIYVKYEFGDRKKIKFHFEENIIYVDRKWTKLKSPISEYVLNKLSLESDITYIMDMESVTSSNREEWLNDQTEADRHTFYLIEEEAFKLFNEEKLPLVEKAEIDKTPGSYEKPSNEFVEDEELTVGGSFSVESADDSVVEESLIREVEKDTVIQTEVGDSTVKDIAEVDGFSEAVAIHEKVGLDDGTLLAEDRWKVNPLLSGEVISNNNESTTSSTVQDNVGVGRFSDAVVIHEKVGFDDGTLLAEESWKVDPIPSTDEEKLAIDVVRNVNIFSDESSSFGNSEEFVANESISQTRYTIQEKCIGVFGTFRNNRKSISKKSVKRKDYFEIDAKCLVRRSLEFKTNMLTQARISDITYSTENFPVLPSSKASRERGQTTRLSEEYMFNYLQDYYRIKYPNSQFDLTNAVFNISIKLPVDESISQTRHAVQGKSIRLLGSIRNEPKFHSSYESFKSKDGMEADAKSWVPRAVEIQREKLIPVRISDVSHSTENSPPLLSPEASSEECQIKRQSEEYVFNYLQEHYRNKYPNSQFDLGNGVFEISDNKQRSHNMKVIWLNANGEKGLHYDLLLEKGGSVKRVIVVQSDVTFSDSFNMGHGKFIKIMNHSETEFPEHKEKYCIYHVSYVINSLRASIEKLTRPALYKVLPLKNLST